eukprot:2939109-Pyramimonas_sp.AAC.1
MSFGGKGQFGGRPWFGKGGGRTFAPRCSGGGAPNWPQQAPQQQSQGGFVDMVGQMNGFMEQ